MKNISFRDIAIPVQCDEARSGSLCQAQNGNTYFTVCAKGYVLNINLEDGSMQQVHFPENLVEYPFASIYAKNGLFYTGAGKMFMEFDPVSNTFSHYSQPCNYDTIAAFSLAESPDGLIYFSTYPSTHLISFSPETKAYTDYGQMDPTEKYVSHIAIDNSGWIYLAISTEKANIIAFNPQTKEKIPLVDDANRTKGYGYVHLGMDGNIYGHAPQKDTEHTQWKRFKNGLATDIEEDDVSQSCYVTRGTRIHDPNQLNCVNHLNMPDKQLSYLHPKQHEAVEIKLNYQSEGAHLAPLTAGPDGNIYGSSMHPMNFYRYDPVKEQLTEYGNNVTHRGAGGNICAYATQGTVIGGAAYSGGYIVHFDTAKPTTLQDGPDKNPYVITQYEEIHRPRSAVAVPDGQHIIFGGFAGYGDIGGALCIYNAQTKEHELIPNSDLVPNQSTMTMRILNNGDLIAGTSIETPGGATPVATDAEIYRYNLNTRRMIYRCVPLKGIREISLFEYGSTGKLHCLTSNSQYFVFDPETREVCYRQDLSQYGKIVRDGIQLIGNGNIYGLLSETIFCIEPNEYEPKIIAQPPTTITAGMAVVNNTIYYAAGSHLIRFEI